MPDNQSQPTYPPLYTLKPFGQNIWIVDGDTISFYGLPFSTRMTVVKLENGDLWIHSPVDLTPELKHEIDNLGPVKYIISPNKIHYWWIPAWQSAYPKAKTYASPGVKQRSKKHKIKFDADLEKGEDFEWSDQIKQTITWGSLYLPEVVFFHQLSKTLIVTDLIENFEAEKLPFNFRFLAWVGGALAPRGGLTRDQKLMFIFGKSKLKQAVQTMLNWQPEKIIVAHGKCFEKNAGEEIKRVFGFLNLPL